MSRAPYLFQPRSDGLDQEFRDAPPRPEPESADAAQQILDSLVAERGGISKFNRAQVEYARVATRLLLDMCVVGIGEGAKHAAEISKYLSYLPPLLPARTNGSGRLDTSNLSTQELSRLYAQMLANPTIGTEADDGPVIDAEADVCTMEAKVFD
jgi:hypothetical protein